ncbi:glycosyltransferase family 4 protein [Candidatus Bathyarchaeota archaeon]|nr:glycosyltransferase family 4 protein [Candidatus Bathyarchaeota archaeon]
MKKLSLAVFNTQPPHLYYGGVERRIVETAKRLHNNVDTTVYSGTKAGFRKPASVNGVKFVPCFSTDALFPLDNWFFNRTLAGAVDAIKADVYEAHTVSGYGFLKALREQRIKKPFIQTVHGVLADEYMQSLQGTSPTFRTKLANLIMWQFSKIEEETAKNATLIVTVSKYSSEKTVQFYDVDKSKIRVVPNGVDTQRFKPSKGCETLKRQIGLDSKLCVLFVGRLIPRKGLPFLIEAAKRIVKEYSQTMFVVVGNGPLKNNLRAHLEKMNLSGNFVFLGDVQESVLPALYNCADVFALPSIQEGQGIALLEAQATAKPVVAFDVGGVREAVLNKETGILMKPDSRQLAEAIMKLLASWSLREKMGSKGREFVSDNFSWDVCAQRMLQVYREAAGA